MGVREAVRPPAQAINSTSFLGSTMAAQRRMAPTCNGCLARAHAGAWRRQPHRRPIAITAPIRGHSPGDRRVAARRPCATGCPGRARECSQSRCGTDHEWPIARPSQGAVANSWHWDSHRDWLQRHRGLWLPMGNCWPCGGSGRAAPLSALPPRDRSGGLAGEGP